MSTADPTINYEYNFFDTLRESLTSEYSSSTGVERTFGSSVIRVAQNSVPDDENVPTHRLIHLAVQIGLSRGGVTPNLSAFDQSKAALLAAHHFNNRIESVVPNLRQLLKNKHGSNCDLRMTMDFYDTELNPRVAVQALTQSIHPRPFPYEPTAVVGAHRSPVSIPMAILNSVRQIPQISYISKSTELDDRTYSLFGRVITSTTGDAQAAVDYFHDVAKTTHLGILYQDDEYGTGYRLELERIAFQRGIATKSVPVAPVQTLSDDLHIDVLRAAKILSQTGYRHFMGVVQNPQFKSLLDIGLEQEIMGPGTFWLFGDAVIVGDINELQYPIGSPQAIALQGNGILSSNPAKDDTPFYHAFRKEVENRLFNEYWATKSPLATDSVQFDANYTSESLGDFSHLAYDAVMALGIAGCKSEHPFFTGQELFDEFTNSNFTGGSGRVLIDKSTGTRQYTSSKYVILNIQAKPNVKLSTVQSDVSVAAEFVQNTTSRGAMVAQWENRGDHAYVYSDFTTSPPPSLPPLEIESIVDQTSYGIVVALASILVMSSIGFALWTLFHRKSHVVRTSQPTFLLVICFGEVLMAMTVVMIGAASPPHSGNWASFSCMPAIWVFGVGFSLVFSALFAKTWRINKLLGHGSHFQRVTVTLRDAALPGCFLVLGCFVVTAAWQATDPLKFELKFDEFGSLDRFGRPLDVVSTCATRNGLGVYFATGLFLIFVVTLVAANFQAYKARRITSEYSESVYIGWAMAISLQGILLAIPAVFFDSDPTSTFLARSAVILLLASSTLFLIFVPKVCHQKAYVKQQEAKAEWRRQREQRSLAAAQKLQTLCEIQTGSQRTDFSGTHAISDNSLDDANGAKALGPQTILPCPSCAGVLVDVDDVVTRDRLHIAMTKSETTDDFETQHQQYKQQEVFDTGDVWFSVQDVVQAEQFDDDGKAVEV